MRLRFLVYFLEILENCRKIYNFGRDSMRIARNRLPEADRCFQLPRWSISIAGLVKTMCMGIRDMDRDNAEASQK
jgi:hypothetical protein